MIENNETKKALPPYLPFKSLMNFLDGLKSAMPQRIDRSLMKSYSGTMQAQLMTALEYLRLINPETGTPTDMLIRFVQAEGEDRQSLLSGILRSSYGFLFQNGLDLDRATPDQLQERFRQGGVSGDTLRKCVTFFLKAARVAGIPLSPHFKKTYGPRSSTTRTRRKPIGTQEQPLMPQSNIPSASPSSSDSEVAKILSEKFPAFNPEWSAEVQEKWFDGFTKLLDRFEKKESDD